MLQSLTAIALLLSGTFVMASPPSLCVPPNKVDQKNSYTYYDMTNHCKETGYCKEACVTFIESTACARPFDKLENTNVQMALYDQIKKDGISTSSRRGPWYVTFGGFTTAIPNRDVIDSFDTALSDYMNDRGRTPLNIYFQETAVGSDQVYIIEGVRDNCN